jgi:hypothetical protein
VRRLLPPTDWVIKDEVDYLTFLYGLRAAAQDTNPRSET